MICGIYQIGCGVGVEMYISASRKVTCRICQIDWDGAVEMYMYITIISQQGDQL